MAVRSGTTMRGCGSWGTALLWPHTLWLPVRLEQDLEPTLLIPTHVLQVPSGRAGPSASFFLPTPHHDFPRLHWKWNTLRTYIHKKTCTQMSQQHIYNSPKVDTSIHQLTSKQNVVYPYGGILSIYIKC